LQNAVSLLEDSNKHENY